MIPDRPPRWRQALLWAVTAFALAIAAALAWRAVDSGEKWPVYSTLEAPTDSVLGEDDSFLSLPSRTPIVFTPDGRSLIIQAVRHLAQARRCALLQRRAARRIGENDAWLVATAESINADIVGADRIAFARLGARYLRYR